MLTARREQTQDALILHLSGEIDENADFAACVGELAPLTILDCKDVSRINSLGVKAWIQFFQEGVAAGTRLRFSQCSPAVVEQINMIMNFACGGTVESAYLPYCCNACDIGFVGLFRVEDLKKTGSQPPRLNCSHCGSEATFDDFPEEYLRFVSRDPDPRPGT